MTLEEDWERLTRAWIKYRDGHWDPRLVLFPHINDLRKADNKGIDFAIRRLMASKEYNQRIRLYGGISSDFARCSPLRCYSSMIGRECQYLFVGIPELYIVQRERPKTINTYGPIIPLK